MVSFLCILHMYILITKLILLIIMFCACNDNQNKAGYAATPVACGWAGAVFENPKKVKCDRWTDGRTKALIELRVRN